MDNRLLELTTVIVSAYLEHNGANADDVPSLIRSVHTSLKATEEPEAEQAPEVDLPSAAKIKRSIRPDALISFEDGKPYRMLKRHLAGLGMTPADYKAKWGLASDYPMVAPDYSARRSELAKQLGLGQKGGAARKIIAKGKKS